MISTARPRRTDGPIISAIFTGAWRDGTVATALACFMLAVALIGFHPFASEFNPDQLTDGDRVNQIGWGGMLLLCSVAGLIMADARRLYALLSPWWILLIGLILLSVLRTPDPFDAFRGTMFTFIGMTTVVVVLALPRTQMQMASVFAFAALSLLLLSYVTVFAFPASGVHQAGGFESEHAGLWRGVYPHKNVAGPVAACSCFVGLYLMRLRRIAIGAAIFLLAAIFVYNTGSKTTLALIGLTATIVLTMSWAGMRALLPLVFFAGLAALAVATLGIVYIDPLREWVNTNWPHFTYTGRTQLWDFAGRKVLEKPWTGYGYGNFWGTSLVRDAEPHFDELWDFRKIGDSHNGYLDLMVTGGIPALVLGTLAFWFAPMADFLRTPRLRQNILFADLLVMIVVFTTFNAFLETFFFNRTDPVWMYLLIGCFGLRIPARFSLHEDGPPR